MRHDVIQPSRDLFSPKDVCETMGHKHTLIAKPLPPAYLDCMGTKISLTEFCQKMSIGSARPLLRGHIDPVSGQVACQQGSAVNLSLRCHERNQQYCETAAQGCGDLQKIFAIQLELTHSSLLPEEGDHLLNCYFSKQEAVDESQFLIPMLDRIESL